MAGDVLTEWFSKFEVAVSDNNVHNMVKSVDKELRVDIII